MPLSRFGGYRNHTEHLTDAPWKTPQGIPDEPASDLVKNAAWIELEVKESPDVRWFAAR